MEYLSKTLYVGLDVHKDSITVAYTPEVARVLTMKRAPPGPGRVRALRHRPTKPRAVEGSQSTIAKGGAISVFHHRGPSPLATSPASTKAGAGPNDATARPIPASS
jgi:hypothetical protein